MRFLLLNQFYAPDPAPTGQYLHGLAEALVKRGHNVKVFCSRCSYDGSVSYVEQEWRDGVEIIRLAASGFGRRGFVGRLLDYLTFYSALAFALIKNVRVAGQKPDVICSLTTPPYIGLLGKMAARLHRCSHAHWIMDLYPDVMAAFGIIKRDGLLSKILQTLTKFQFRGAGAVIALGPTMAEKVRRHTDGAATSIPLWTNLPSIGADAGEEIRALRAKRGWGPEEVVFLYSGNMGLGHRFEEFLAAAERFGAQGPRWVFAGGGKRRREIEEFAKTHPAARIEFLGYAPQEFLWQHLRSGDVHLASLDSAWEGLIVPSKLQGCFAAGRCVIFVGGACNETASWIRESGGGWVVREGDVDGLLAAVREALDPEERWARAKAASDFAVGEFQMAVNCGRLASVLERATRPETIQREETGCLAR